MSKRSAFTLIELLVAAIIVGILSMALVGSFGIGVNIQNSMTASREREVTRATFEDRLRSLLENATVSTDTTDTSTFFLAGSDAAGAEDRLTFTTSPQQISSASIASQDDFETQNVNFGPQGGVEEVSLGLTAVGQAPDQGGLYLREQRPSDGDTTQGGTESNFDANVTSIQWEFFDGLNWQTTWDTAQTNRRIPSTVRVTYQLDGEDQAHVLVVRLYKSDVTPDNPVDTNATGATQ